MRAWRFTAINEPLTQSTVADPTPGPNDVVIDVAAAGLCHSDVGFMDGTITSLLAHIPITLGHEIVGTISSVGSSVSEFSVGDRVGIPAMTEGPGTAMDGGFAERVLAPARLLVRVPDGVSFTDAAPATCAGRTAYRALHTSGGVRAGMKVGIIGFGGLGYFGVQLAKAADASVYVAELDESAWPVARSFGAKGCAATLRDFASEDLDLVIDFAGADGTLDSAIDSVAHGGRIVSVGLGVEFSTVSVQNITMKEVHIVGSSNGTKDEADSMLALIADGSVKPKIHAISFADIADGMERLAKGGVDGRLVATV